MATAIAIGAITLAGCAADVAGSEDDKLPAGEDWGDDTKYPEIGGAYHSLVALTGTCTFDTATSAMTVASSASQTILIGKRAIDSAILVNGRTCGTPAVTATGLKRLLVTGTAGTNEIVILDFLGGLFAPGVTSPTGGGIDVNLGAAGTDELRIRGTAAADTFTVGADGISFNTDNFKDIVLSGTTSVEKLTFALASGNDILVATNPLTPATRGVTGSAALPLVVYGGVGNDVITAGAGSDSVWGGVGNDTLSGGGNGAYAGGVPAETDYLYGEEGLDTIAQDADNNGPDHINCGTEAMPDPTKPVNDVVTYALRGTPTARTPGMIAATDGERILVTVGGTVTADSNADGYPEYPQNDGYTTETLNVLDVASVEKDAISPDCESVVGGQDNDEFTGDIVALNHAEIFSGGPGDDVFYGKDGNDTMNGEAGDDVFFEDVTAANGSDVFNGGLGTDTVDYSARTAALTVTMDGTADDGLGGEADNVQKDVENLIAGSGNDSITGNALANVITGGLGDDTLDGDAGEDVFLEGAAVSGKDVFIGGDGKDLVDYSLRVGGALGITVTMGDELANDGDTATNEQDNVGSDIENLSATPQVDTITGNDLDNEIDGFGGADVVQCGIGDDILILASGTRHVSCEL